MMIWSGKRNNRFALGGRIHKPKLDLYSHDDLNLIQLGQVHRYRLV